MFYGVKEDIFPVLHAVTKKMPLMYALMGNFSVEESENALRSPHPEALPRLGIASAESSAACESYLIYPQSEQLILRTTQRSESITRVCVDQLANPNSVTIAFGGLLDTDTLLSGRIATASNSPVSQSIIKLFHATIKRSFVKVQAFYVGPESLSILRRGGRLTIGKHSPAEFDLVEPPQ